MPFLTVNNELLFFEGRDGESSRALVLIHGSGADHSHWPKELMTLPDYNIYMLDLPGHGRSSGSGRDSVAAYADVVADFIARHGLREVVLFGHSLGSAIVLTLALRRPAWLKALVLVGAGARLKVLPALLEQLETDFPGAVELICQYLFGPQAAPTLVEAERQRYLTVDWRLIRNDFLACNQFDVMTRLSEIEVPTLVITGGADALTPIKYGQYLKDQMPQAELVVIPIAGHMVAREKPQEFVQAVGPWLQVQFEGSG
ncbi:MAG: alpha/beta hydrolase [Candidatus Competibacteraceae bacterium]